MRVIGRRNPRARPLTFSFQGKSTEVLLKPSKHAMAKALHKVQKQISKKRVHKSSNLHENSRDAQRLRRAGGREDKINKLLTAAVRSNEVYGRATIARVDSC